jgi:hypothetical protein
LEKINERPLGLIVMVSLPYTVVKHFKRNYFRMPKKMRMFAKIWLTTVIQYSFDALATQNSSITMF